MKSRAFTVLITVTVIVLLASAPATVSMAAQPGAFPKPGPLELVFASGPQGGSWLVAAAAIGELVQKEIPGSMVHIQPGGGVTNMKLVEKGEAQLGLATSISFVDALQGKPPFDTPCKKMRAIANLYPTIQQMAVLADSGIKKVDDIVGKSLVPSAPGMVNYEINAAVLDVYGLTYEELKKRGTKLVLTKNQGQAMDMLKDKQIDAVWWATACPSPGFVEAALSRNLRFLGMESDKLSQFLKKYPMYSKVEMPANTYKGQTEPVPTVGMFTTLIVNSDLSDAAAYWITRTIWENRSALVSAMDIMSYMQKNTVGANMQVELHPGAKKFYQEIGAKMD